MPLQTDHKVLIVGCGELGSRHLQAVASIASVAQIEVVDPRPEALALGQERLAETAQHASPTEVRWLTTLDEASPGEGLCIIATRAENRCQLTKTVAHRLGYRLFLLEKMVGQSVSEVEGLAAYSRSEELSIWTNHKARAYPFHLGVKEKLAFEDPVVFSAVGGNHGLATNGVHAADLFAFYDGSDTIKSAGSHVDPVLHPSKRGGELFDLSGTLMGYTDKGGKFTLSYAADHQNSDQFSISTRRYRCIVDHLQRWAVESAEESSWVWRSIPFEDRVLVSEMTADFASDILVSGSCSLPTLDQSLVAHRFILNELQPHFERLLDRTLDLCPVT